MINRLSTEPGFRELGISGSFLDLSIGTTLDAYGVLNGSVRSGINIDMLVESDDKSLSIRRPFDEICDFFDVGDICTSTFD